MYRVSLKTFSKSTDVPLPQVVLLKQRRHLPLPQQQVARVVMSR
jgi:hypothetical protein